MIIIIIYIYPPRDIPQCAAGEKVFWGGKEFLGPKSSHSVKIGKTMCKCKKSAREARQISSPAFLALKRKMKIK